MTISRQKRLRWLNGFIILAVFLLDDPIVTHAHYIQSHLEMTYLAKTALIQDQSNYPGSHFLLGFLGADRGDGETFFEAILDGARDADLRVNGIYNIDPYCNDYDSVETISDVDTFYNADYDYAYDYKPLDVCGNVNYKDIIDWPVGDHGYNPNTGEGFYLQEIDDQMARIQSSDRLPGLLTVLDGETEEEKLTTLRTIMSISNARAMAEEFYARAQSAWQESRYIDAMYYLGIVIHLVQDMSAPGHVHCGETIDCQEFHEEFERRVWVDYLLPLNSALPANISPNYSVTGIGELMHTTASVTYSIPNDIPNDQILTANLGQSVEIGIQATTSALALFFREVQLDYAKYDIKWSKLFDGGYDETANGVAVDRAGNIFVIGNSDTGTERNLVLNKYDNLGTLIWSASYDTTNLSSGSEVAIDSDQNIVVCGNEMIGGYYDALIIKFDQTGSILWSETYDYGGRTNGANGLGIDSNDNILFGGTFNDTGIQYDDDYYLIKLDEDGNILWQRTYATSGHDMAFDVAVDSQDNVIQVGQSPYYGLHAVKYDPNGAVLWTRAYYTGHYGRAEAVAVGPDDSVYMTGYYHSDILDSCGNATHDIRTIKLSPVGAIVWIRDYDSGCGDVGHEIAVDNYGNVFVLGTVNGLSSIIVYDPEGNQIHEMLNIDNDNFARRGIVFDIYNSFFTVGYTASDPKDWLLLKYSFGFEDSDGHRLPDLFEDDFNDNSIDLSKWIISGHTVYERNGLMELRSEATDNEGIARTDWIEFDPNKLLIFERDTLLHYANNYFIGRFEIYIEGAPVYTFGLNYANMSYDSGSYNALYGTYLFKNDSSGHSDSDLSGHSVSIPTKWDQWFHEKIVYNAQSGLLQYYVDDQLQIAYDIGPIPPLDTYRFSIRTHPWGWYTGHYEYMDNFIVYPFTQPEIDSDGDGLTDTLENAICTDPVDADTDDDGILDGVEDANHNGIVDTGETKPCDPDSDSDGVQDGTETGLTTDDVGSETDLTVFMPDADPSTTTNPTLADTDGDGLLDGEEDVNANGRVDPGEGDPNVHDNVTEPRTMPWIPLLLLDE
jgi:hypothetical protein